MKRSTFFPVIAFVLLASFVYVGCGAKETSQTEPIVENIKEQTSRDIDTPLSPEAALKDKPQSPEAALKDKPRSPEAELKDKPRSPEAALKDKPRSPEAELKDKPQSPEAALKDKPRRSPEAELKDKPRSPEAELKDKPQSPEAALKDKPRRSPEAELKDKPRSPEAELKDKPQSPEAALKDKPRRSPEAELKDKPRSPEAELIEKSPSVSEKDVKSEEITSEQKTKVEQIKIEIPQDSVLHLIPETALNVIYCPSLFELDDKINLLVTNLMPQAGPAPEFLAQILAGAFGAGFESLAELEEIGLDLNADFAIFMTSLDPPSLSAAVHLTDPDAIKQVIEAEAEGSEPIQYNGQTYYSSAEDSGSFAILDNTLIFSQQPEICENVIDIKSGSQQSIIQHPDYVLFLTNIMKGTEQISGFINLESIIDSFGEALKEELQSTLDTIQSDPAAMQSVPFIEGMFSKAVEFLEELKSFSMSIQIDGTDVQLNHFLKFIDGGKIHNALEQMAPDELGLINDLPNSSVLSGGFKGNSELFYKWSLYWLQAMSSDADGFNISSENIDTFFEEMKGFYDALADEWSFSVNLRDTFIPDYMVIYDLKDEQKMQTYMDEQFLEQMQKGVQLIRDSMGDSPQLSMYDGVYVGNPIIYNEVEIKTFVFPNFHVAFQDVPPDMAMFFPEEWEWSYAISEGQLFLGFGGPQQIQAALDSKAKVTESIVENVSYQNLIGKLGTENNLLLGISPLTIAKSVLNIVAEADPGDPADMQMVSAILMGIPENYSIGISAKVGDGGIGTSLLLTLGDFKQLIGTVMMMSGMGMMQ